MTVAYRMIKSFRIRYGNFFWKAGEDSVLSDIQICVVGSYPAE